MSSSRVPPRQSGLNGEFGSSLRRAPRQEDRTVEVFPVGDALAATEWQPFVKTITRVTRRTLLRSAATGMWTERGEVASYLSSTADLSATVWGAKF